MDELNTSPSMQFIDTLGSASKTIFNKIKIKQLKEVLYNEDMLTKEQLTNLDELIARGLNHTPLEGKRYSDKLTGSAILLEEALDIICDI